MTASNAPKRDFRGRFAKGSSGNPNGRPRKVNVRRAIDIGHLAREEIQANIGGDRTRLTRKEITILKLFEAAARGNVQAAIYLDKRFQKHSEEVATMIANLQRLVKSWITDRPGQHVPDEVLDHISRLVQWVNFELTGEC